MGLILGGEAPDDAAEAWLKDAPRRARPLARGRDDPRRRAGPARRPGRARPLTRETPQLTPMARRTSSILMVDQLAGTLFPDGPAGFLHAPNLARLAERSVRFANAYTASPLCAPARAAFMSGQLPRRTGVYDNAAEFASDVPTFAHHLRRAGYAHLPLRQDALRRPGPAARLRGAADHRHLPGRLRLDAGLRAAGRAHRLVVPQPRLGDRRRRRRDHQPARVRRRGRLPRPAKLYDLARAPRRPAVVPDGQLHPPARPLRRAAALLGPLRRLPGARCRRRRRSPTTTRTRIRSG